MFAADPADVITAGKILVEVPVFVSRLDTRCCCCCCCCNDGGGCLRAARAATSKSRGEVPRIVADVWLFVTVAFVLDAAVMAAMVASATTEVGSGADTGAGATRVMAAGCTDDCNVPNADEELDPNTSERARTPSIK